MCTFMRQIPYLSEWKQKELTWLIMFYEERIYENRGHVIAREGDPSDKIFVVLSGDVEVVKTDINHVFFNQ